MRLGLPGPPRRFRRKAWTGAHGNGVMFVAGPNEGNVRSERSAHTRLDEPQMPQVRNRCFRGAHAAKRCQTIEIDAFAQPQPHEQYLVGLLGGCQLRHFSEAVTVCFDERRPGFGIFLCNRREPRKRSLSP